MTFPANAFRRQGQAHKGKGAGAIFSYDGAFTSEHFTFINGSAATDDLLLVTGVPNTRIKVLSFALYGSEVTITTRTAVFNTQTDPDPGVAISPLYSMVSAAASFFEKDNNGLFQTEIGDNLTISTPGDPVSCRITYILVQ